MNTTRIREALVEVRDAVEVPAFDELAVRSRARTLRRRRTAGRVLAAACVVAAVTGPVLWLAPTTSPRTDRPTPAHAPLHATAPQQFPFVRDGRLTTVLPDDSGFGTGLRVEEVLGSGPAGVVVIGRDSHLLLVPLAADGQPLKPRDLGDGRPVQRAALDKSGTHLAFVDLGDRVHVRSVGSAADLVPAAALPASARLLAVDGTRWMSEDGGTVTLHQDGLERVLAADGSVVGAEIAGGVVAYETDTGTVFLDAASGRRRASVEGVGTGSLSPDGRWYVAAPFEQQVDAGAAQEWYLVDTATGARTVFAGRPPRARAVTMTWQDDDRFLVLFTDSRQPGNRIVSDCSVALGTCAERYDDAGNTLQIATR